VWYFLYAVESSNVVESIDAWGQTSMEAENLIVDESGKREVVEEICEVFPHVCVAIFPETFIVEAIDLGDLTRFVIATEDCDALRISDFESNEESNSFNGIISPIHIITCTYVQSSCW
jgi:hypothetical protein